MAERLLSDIKRYVGFGDADVVNLRQLARVVRPWLPEIIDEFYGRILGHPGAREVLKGGETQLRRLRVSLAEWVEQLFAGIYDEHYARQRLQIGQTHVRVGMPQHYMFAAMETVWQSIERRVRAAHVAGDDDKLRSLHKLLTIDTALMLDSYKQSYSEQIREIEHAAVRERLNQAEHLAHIGHLAANLAHEIKNPLAGISGAIQVLREPLPADHPHRPILSEVLRQIDRLDGTVKDLLVYARPKPPRFKRCNLNRLIERVLTVLTSEPELQRVGIDYVDSQKLDLFADEAQLEQLLLNLLLNAAQAAPDGSAVRLLVSSSPEGLRLMVEDDGVGMDEDTLRQAFEPFYTTKTRGTGLGLPICRKIVEAHAGTISIQSTPGQGTAVTIRLPRFPPASTGGQESDDYSRLNH